MDIRLCDRSDSDAILTILNDVIVTSPALWDYVPRPPESMAGWFDAKEQGGNPVIGAFDGETLHGFATYGPFRAWPAYEYTVENSIHIHRDDRGKGLGRALLQATIDAAREQQYHVIVAGIESSNEASKILHEKFGFAACAVIRETGFKFGRWLDLEFYQLILDTPVTPVEGWSSWAGQQTESDAEEKHRCRSLEFGRPIRSWIWCWNG